MKKQRKGEKWLQTSANRWESRRLSWPVEPVVAFLSWSREAKPVKKVPSCWHHLPGVLSQLRAQA